MGASYPPNYSERGKLPILVGILAILVAIVGFIVLLAGLLLLLVAFGVISVGSQAFFLGGLIFDSLVITGAYFFFLGLVMLVVATGLWDTEIWALWVTGAVVVFELIGSLLAGDWLYVLVFVVLLAYLVGVRHHFY